MIWRGLPCLEVVPNVLQVAINKENNGWTALGKNRIPLIKL